MREDFPENDEESHLGYAQIIAEAIQGIGIDESNIGIPDAIWADYKPEQVKGMTAKQEFEQSLLPCLSGEKSSEDNWLSKALIGLNSEDNQKMQDAPSYENLARASDFIGTATNWAMAFKAEKQKQNIRASQARDIERLNRLANYKAQVVQTLSSNMAHIRDNHKLLYKLDLWTQATVHQTTGFKLAQRVLKYSPDANHTFTFLVSAQYKKGIMLDTGTLKELGKESNRPLVNLVEAEIRKDPTATYLQLEVDKINSRLKRLNSIAPSAGIALSSGLVFLQTRAMFTNLEAMGRDVSLSRNMESGSAAVGASLMVMSASIELAANITQLRAVTKELQIKAAQRSLLAATIGMYAGWVEVGYLYFYSKNRNSVPRGYLITNGVAVAAFSFAGRALAEVMAKRTGARLGVMFVFSQAGGIALFANPYFLVGVMVIGLGVSLWSYFKMSVYDKSIDNLNKIDYWLDFGAFGKRELLTDNYSSKNPFKSSDSGSGLSFFSDAAREVAVLAVIMRKNDIKIIIRNSITSECDITLEITSYLPISEKDTISYEITTFYKPKEFQYQPYSDFDGSSYIKHKVTVNDSVPLNKLLKLETRDDVFARIGQTSRINQNGKVELPKGLSSYRYTQTEEGYKLLLKFVIYESGFEFDRVNFKLDSTAYDKKSDTTYTQEIPESKKAEEKPYVLMRDR